MCFCYFPSAKIPDLNPIEKIWLRLKVIRNKFRVKDIDQLFKDYWNDLLGI